MDKVYVDRQHYCDNICKCNGTECVKSKCPIWTAPAADVAPVVHGEWIATTKHKWKTNKSGEVDDGAWDYEYHNGPVCTICHFSPCVHCNPDWEEDEDCHKHFVCSECGLHVEEKHPFCHCGAKMDGGKRDG